MSRDQLWATEVVVPLPARAVKMIADVLQLIADRRPVSLIPLDAELTTQQAASCNVSRPFLVGLLEKNEIPFRLVGSHRKVKVADEAFFSRSLKV